MSRQKAEGQVTGGELTTAPTSFKILGQAFFGMLPEDLKQRLTAVLQNPTQETWDAAFTIIVNPAENLSLWEAVCQVDKWFPREGPRHHLDSGLTEPWSKVPTEHTLAAALLLAMPLRSTKTY